MWLPRDERYLLLGYYMNMGNIDDPNICEPDKIKWFDRSDWSVIYEKLSRIPFLNPPKIKKAASGIEDYFTSGRSETPDGNCESTTVEENKRRIKEYLKNRRRFDFANTSLKKRNLIKIKKHESESDAAGISLTIEGYDLGRKYSSWLDYTGQWFMEYKDHWIMLILGVLGGVLGSLLLKLF